MVYGRNLKMSKKGTYSHVNHFFDRPDLVQRFRQSRTNYDFPKLQMSALVDHWFILESFVDSVKTSHGDRMLLIVSELSDPTNPESAPTGMRYKVFSSSRLINEFLEGLRTSDEEIRALPMTFKIIAIKFHDKKSNKDKVRYEFYSGF